MVRQTLFSFLCIVSFWWWCYLSNNLTFFQSWQLVYHAQYLKTHIHTWFDLLWTTVKKCIDWPSTMLLATQLVHKPQPGKYHISDTDKISTDTNSCFFEKAYRFYTFFLMWNVPQMIEYGLLCVFGCVNTLITLTTNHNNMLPASAGQWGVGGTLLF